ncbi:glutathione S-transferase family protein [Sideroxydans sp. CL21]|uniref:glutathione S-transferase family protein n=1 Tax=Sideroxydans sp. CL21 TaxID=2600596 RepID=UPI0012A7EDA3|nr:glutathione S-transferase family protein [Sideroxydans sp. CL21]VVC82841.1 Glutathione S-transferase (EC 2.5.1.18) [Sideroxydans sp. CL21]
MYELFIANKNYSSWSLRPWVLMRELSIPFTETLIPFGNLPDGTTIADVSPSGRVPCLKDGQLRVWDSLSIVEYLAERHEHVWPSSAATRAYARSAAAEMHSGFFELRQRCGMNCGICAPLVDIAAPLALELERLNALWLKGLEKFGGPFLAGPQFTAVDAFYAPVAFRVQTYGLQLKPAAMQYVARLLELEAMREWYAAALKEPWREEQYEAAVRGILVEDRRSVPQSA